MNRKMFVCLVLLAGVIRQSSGAAMPDASWSSENSRLGLLQRSTLLSGKKVADRSEHTIGKLEDLVIDVPRGRVCFTLVATGGGDQFTLIPAQCYAYLSRPRLVLNIDRKALTGAPQVPRANPLRALDPAVVRQTCDHFDLKGAVAGDPGGLSTGSGLVGAAVLSQSKELLGHIKDIMVDLPLGRAVFLVVEPIAPTAQDNRLYIVPPAVLRADISGATLQLNCTSAHFLAGPHFQPELWTDLAFAEIANRVRQHYHVPEATGTTLVAATPSQPPVKNPEPGAGSASRSDEAITKAILAELVRDTGGFLSVSVNVTTVNGKVKVSGKVRSEKQRKLIITAAERVAGPGNVDDQLDTGAKTKTAQL